MLTATTGTADKFIFLPVRRGNTHQSNSLLELHTESRVLRLAIHGYVLFSKTLSA